MKNKAVNAPIKFEEIVMVMINSTMLLLFTLSHPTLSPSFRKVMDVSSPLIISHSANSESGRVTNCEL